MSEEKNNPSTGVIMSAKGRELERPVPVVIGGGRSAGHARTDETIQNRQVGGWWKFLLLGLVTVATIVISTIATCFLWGLGYISLIVVITILLCVLLALVALWLLYAAKFCDKISARVVLRTIGVPMLVFALAAGPLVACNLDNVQPRDGVAYQEQKDPDTKTAPAASSSKEDDGSWEMKSLSNDQKRLLAKGIPGDWSTDGAATLLVNWLEAIKVDKHLLAEAAKGILKMPSVDPSSLEKDGRSTEKAKEIVDALFVHFTTPASASRKLEEPSEKEVRNTGFDGESVVVSEFVGMTGDKRVIRLTDKDGAIMYIAIRCGNFVYRANSVPVRLKVGPTDEPRPEPQPQPKPGPKPKPGPQPKPGPKPQPKASNKGAVSRGNTPKQETGSNPAPAPKPKPPAVPSPAPTVTYKPLPAPKPQLPKPNPQQPKPKPKPTEDPAANKPKEGQPTCAPVPGKSRP